MYTTKNVLSEKCFFKKCDFKTVTMKISRQLTEFPTPLDHNTTPYQLNQWTPSARSLSDWASKCDISDPKCKIPVRMAKAVIVGDNGVNGFVSLFSPPFLYVGKSSLIARFCRNTFDANYKPTIGIDYEMERFFILNGIPFNVQFWDTAGQEKFKCIASSYYRGSNVVVTVFDASNLESLSTCQRWMDDAVNANTIVPLKFLVATKMDLVNESHRDKIFQMGSRMANLLGAEYWPVSSKSGENVETFFRRITALAFEMGLVNSPETLARLPTQINSHVLRPSNSRDGKDSSRQVIAKCSSCKSL